MRKLICHSEIIHCHQVPGKDGHLRLPLQHLQWLSICSDTDIMSRNLFYLHRPVGAGFWILTKPVEWTSSSSCCVTACSGLVDTPASNTKGWMCIKVRVHVCLLQTTCSWVFCCVTAELHWHDCDFFHTRFLWSGYFSYTFFSLSAAAATNFVFKRANEECIFQRSKWS